MNKLKPNLKIKTIRSKIGNRLYVIAYGYKIVFNRIDKTFLIVDGSILCCIKFNSLKDAILTAKMNCGTYVQGYQSYDGCWKFYRPKFKMI